MVDSKTAIFPVPTKPDRDDTKTLRDFAACLAVLPSRVAEVCRTILDTDSSVVVLE